MAGGTGGHVFPGLALAQYLRDRQIEVHWLGTKQGLEARLVPEQNIPLHFISISGIRGKGAKALLLAPWRMMTALMQSLRIIRQVKPEVVIGMGGFVSGPGGVAAWLLRYPLVIHEQNAKVGMTNRYLSYLAARVLQAFPQAFTPQKKVITTGNPVRADMTCLLPPEQRMKNTAKRMRLLVIGGSLGAAALNELVPDALANIPLAERPEVCHQSGEKHFSQAKAAYAAKGIDVELVPFIHDMGKAYSWADMVLCRAGALTLAELCAVGVGAIFVPYPHAVDDHQTANAQYLVQQAAALCIPQAGLTAEHLAAILMQFTQSPEKRLAMAQAAYQLRRVDVTERMYEILKELV